VMAWLEKLGYSGRRLFDAELVNGNKEILLTDGVDCYFETALNKKEFGEVIDELKELHSKMIDGVQSNGMDKRRG